MDRAPAPTLRREIGRTSTLLITVGAMIGSGVFATPHEVAGLIASPTLTLALWLVGGVLSLLGALSFAELGAAIPETGGMYRYLHRAFGPIAAFAFAWAMLAVLVPSSMGFFAQVAARHLVSLVSDTRAWDTPVAAAIIVLLVLVNLAGVRSGAGVQNAATLVKYGGVLLVAALGLLARPSAHGHAVTVSGGMLAPIAALVPILWAYDGWVDVTSLASEVRDPARDIPRALILGTALVTVLYLLVNVAYLRLLGTATLAGSETPAADAAARVWGGAGRAAVSALVAVATFGGCAVALLTGSRVIYAVAADGYFLHAFAHTSRAAVPDVAITASGALAIVYITSRLGYLGEVFVVGAWPFYALGAVATIVLRRREPELLRPHRTILYPYPIVVFAAVALAIVVGYAFTRPTQSAISLGVIAVGVPVFALIRSSRARSTTAP